MNRTTGISGKEKPFHVVWKVWLLVVPEILNVVVW